MGVRALVQIESDAAMFSASPQLTHCLQGRATSYLVPSAEGSESVDTF
jgi:hypothetical protein